MASSLFMKRSFQSGNNNNSDADEKKNEQQVVLTTPRDNGNVSTDVDPMMSLSEASSMVASNSGLETPRESEMSYLAEEEEEGDNLETMSIISDAAIVMSDGGDPLQNISAPTRRGKDAIVNIASDIDTSPPSEAAGDSSNNSSSCPKWSTVLSTPSNISPLLTPSSDLNSLKSNLHGLGLKYSIDRSKILSRTGKGCATLLFDIASLHDDLLSSLAKLTCPSLLENVTANTPMEHFAKDVTSCLQSFVRQTKTLGTRIKNDVARPYQESSATLSEEALQQYSRYSQSRIKCGASRKEALKLRRRYVDSFGTVDHAIGNLRRARAASKGRKRKTSDSSSESGGGGSDGGRGEGEHDSYTSMSPTSWEEELRQFGEKNSLTAKCEAVIRASEDVKSAQTNYASSVASENAAVEDAQDMEKIALDSVQRLEEERIVFLIGLLDRFLQDSKESLENMSLDLKSVEPLNLSDNKDITSSSTHAMTATATPTTPSSLFMSPRRRAQSDDGPAINETRMLNLPDNLAEIRDNMKSLIVKQLNRLKTLKQIASFNENLACAFETFGSSLKSQLESSPSTAVLNKNEGTNVLSAWNSAIGSIESYAKYAELLSKQIKMGNNELQIILVSADRDAKMFQEKEEFRWKSLCDAARVETKSKMKHKQCVADLEKARARVTLVDGEGGEDGTSGDGDNANNSSSNSGNISPQKQSLLQAQSTKMDRHMNKAMGRMFSILPGGGEDVMNKVLTPQQRQAIATRQLDEAKTKEEKVIESFEVARSVKKQAAVSYETEAEATTFKFRNDDRHEWDTMQRALFVCVDSIKKFRGDYLKNSVLISIESMKSQKVKALEDVMRWTEFTESRVRDQRARCVDNDAKEKEIDEEQQPSGESGFSLRVQLVETTDTPEVLVRRFLDEAALIDDDVDAGDGLEENVAAEPPSKEEVNGDDVKVKEAPAPKTPLPEVPPDAFIDKMDPIFTKKLKNVSIDEYYNAGWSEDTPLYGPWLERKGSFDVTVGDWEHSREEDEDDGGGFENVWSGEKFSQKRVIKFKFKRSTHLYIGPPVAGVTQTQYLIKEGNDRCIVMMTVEMDGIPYSDSFAVEVRWAARRWKDNDIAVDAGVCVRFTKSNMFASKIKSGTLKETSPIHLDLFDVIKSAIASTSDEGDEGVKDLEVEELEDEEITNRPAEINEPSLESSTKSETISQIESMFRQFVATFSSLSQNQQLLLACIVLYFVTKIFTRKGDVRSEAIDDKVDNLTNEVREMKAMLESILKLSEQRGLYNDEL